MLLASSLLKEIPQYLKLLEGIKDGRGAQAVVLEAAKPFFLASLYIELRSPLLVITPRPEGARKLYDQVSFWCPQGTRLYLFPEPDALPYETIPPDIVSVQGRLRTLWALSQGDQTPFIIASACASAIKTIPHSLFSQSCQVLKSGMKISLTHLFRRFCEIGYRVERVVEIPGTMSKRGGILDLFPFNYDFPLRLEFWGDEIESIRAFDPKSQRSLFSLPEVIIIPASEEHNSGSILEYLPDEGVLVLDEIEEIKTELRELDLKAKEIRKERELPPSYPVPYFSEEEMVSQWQRKPLRLELKRWGEGEEFSFPFSPAPSYKGQWKIWIREIKGKMEEGYRIIIVSHQAERLSEILLEGGILASPSSLELPSPGEVKLVQGSIAEGWVLNQPKTLLLSDAELFGFVKERRQVKRPVPRFAPLSELSIGDYVVHLENGIGRFCGIKLLGDKGEEKEYLVLEYAEGDKLYVPAYQMDKISRYIGLGEPPTLHRLGSQEWQRAKEKVKRATGDMARELLELYALRELLPGFAFSPDTDWQRELEASFPYEETPDQLQAILEVKRDMEKPRPMDRLVCGDVGYGKTEVAIRASFKAVMDGKQVAVLVPTTILAQQHYETFSKRLAPFPIRIEMLSRFLSEKEQREVIQGLKEGKIDICIGTHRLLQKDVEFKDLGLVIIDEEQRFGVAHKEKLKQMKKEVDVLTLSATPIPRTLYMSLTGIRDISLIETPPEERLPIKTIVSEYKESLLREAILREIGRGGQVFFVHNRVDSIEYQAQKLKSLVPEARITIAHGQMDEEELERIMTEFVQGKWDVLVCTTIIETGLDMPKVNTLIVNDADKLGLTQLYQLRGRVGRGSERAFAYFLYQPGKRLTPEAQKRLETIYRATELGAGFHIAMKDLEIRGAGNLLGPEQSGHIAAVGFELYCELLSQAVEEIKAKKEGKEYHPPPPIPSVSLPLPAYFPEEYIPDVSVRLSLYQRLSQIRDLEQLGDLSQELRDRFGQLPIPVENLLYILEVRILGSLAGVEAIYTDGDEIIISLREGIRAKKEWGGFGVKIGQSQIRIDRKILSHKSWKEELKALLMRMLTQTPSRGRE